MKTLTEPSAHLNGWTYRLRPATVHPARLLVMLHGWQGDENSMELFANSIPGNYSILLPRAPYPAPEGGYTWREVIPGTWGLPSLEDLRPSVEALATFLGSFSSNSGVDETRIDMAGFSQGAALAYSFVMLFPTRVARLAVLSGFLPNDSDGSLSAFKEKTIFISHGQTDELIPIERARQARILLESCGAQIQYCESDGGHKVGKECLKGMVRFFTTG